MQFESKLKRRVWFELALGLIPDAVVAALLVVIFGGGFVSFIATIVGLQVVYFLIWLKDTAWSWLQFVLVGRKRDASTLLDHLVTRSYPEPSDYEQSISGYFERIASDDEEEVIMRLAASVELGAINYSVAQGRIQEGLRLSMAYEDALEAYKRRFI